MPAPSIPSFGTFLFTVGRRSSWVINIGNNPTWGYGVLDWNGDLQIELQGNNLFIYGTPTRAGIFQGNIHLGNADGQAGAAITVSVSEVVTPPPVVARPVIIPKQIRIRPGVNYTENPIEIEIRNKPTSARIHGLLIALNWRFSENGIEIIGTAASHSNIGPGGSSIVVNIDVFASNSGGSDSSRMALVYGP